MPAHYCASPAPDMRDVPYMPRDRHTFAARFRGTFAPRTAFVFSKLRRRTMSDEAQSNPDAPRPEFFKRAQHCVRAAQASGTDDEKAGWLTIAEGWLKLAVPQKSREERTFDDQLHAKHTGQKNSGAVN
jgi:hypothetical protein